MASRDTEGRFRRRASSGINLSLGICTLKRGAMAVLILFSVISTVAGAQSTQGDQSRVLETQAPGYWTDPVTGLKWAGKDNGKAVNWQRAKKFCRDSRLAGYSDWRLPTTDELEGIYDKSAEAPGVNPSSRWHETESMNYHVKGNLFLTGDEWSSTHTMDDRGHPTARVWYFDFLNGVRKGDDTTLLINLWGGIAKSLCVRRP